MTPFVWPQVTLAEVSQIVAGGKSGLSGIHFVRDGYPAFGAGGLNGYLPKFEYDTDAIILSANGARCGKCFLVSGKWASLANTQLIIPDSSRVNVRFLWYQLNDEMSWPKGGTAQPFIRPSDVKSRKVHFPPLPIQKQIAAILEKADAAREKRRRANQLTEQFLQSAFLEMFGDPGRNPKGWKKVKVNELGIVQTGNTPPRNIAKYYGGDIEWIKTDNIVPQEAFPKRSLEGLSKEGMMVGRIAKTGSVLVTCIAGSATTIGNAALTDRDVAFNQQINAVTPFDDVNPWFLYGLFVVNKPLVQKSTTLGMKRIITKSRFQNLVVVKPPLEHQEKFAALVEKVEGLRVKQRESEKELENLFQSLMQRAFKGELVE